jgi:hypothetical protein
MSHLEVSRRRIKRRNANATLIASGAWAAASVGDETPRAIDAEPRPPKLGVLSTRSLQKSLQRLSNDYSIASSCEALAPDGQRRLPILISLTRNTSP